MSDLRIFNIFIIITRILHVIIKHAVLFMDVFQPFKVAKSRFFNNNNNNNTKKNYNIS